MAGDPHASAHAVAIAPAPGRPDRVVDVHRALRLEWLTVAWMFVEATVALGAGIRSPSLVLEAFGADSIVELLSAGVLLWRLHAELHRGGAFPDELETRASRIGGALLFALAAYVTGGAVRSIWLRQGQEFTRLGLLLVAAAIPIMAALTRGKLRIADRIKSRALRADAIESLTCGYLSVVVLAALVAHRIFGAWWLSPLGALVLVPFLLREGREAWHQDACCDCGRTEG